MKQLPRIAARLFCEPWAILPSAHSNMLRQFRAHIGAGGAEEPDEEPCIRPSEPAPGCDEPVGPQRRRQDGTMQPMHSQVRRIGEIAILPITGIIGKHLGMIEMMCGGCDSAIIAKQARAIAADPRITTVIVVIDSPGGACVGAPECASAIRAMSEAGKEVLAFTDTQAASAGYFMAAACDSIFAAPSAIVGSISCFAAVEDESQRYAMDGVQVHVFRDGELKGAGTDGKPWTQAELDDMQRVAEQFGRQFKDFIRARRKLPEELMQGQFWPAQFAPVGLVDGFVDDLDALIAMVRKTSR